MRTLTIKCDRGSCDNQVTIKPHEGRPNGWVLIKDTRKETEHEVCSLKCAVDLMEDHNRTYPGRLITVITFA